MASPHRAGNGSMPSSRPELVFVTHVSLEEAQKLGISEATTKFYQ